MLYRYEPTGVISYKLQFDDDWIPLEVGAASERTPSKLVRLFNTPQKLKAKKFANLMHLKAVIPAEHHGYYDSLPHY